MLFRQFVVVESVVYAGKAKNSSDKLNSEGSTLAAVEGEELGMEIEQTELARRDMTKVELRRSGGILEVNEASTRAETPSGRPMLCTWFCASTARRNTSSSPGDRRKGKRRPWNATSK